MFQRLIPFLSCLSFLSAAAWPAAAAGDPAARLQRALDDLAVMEALLDGGVNEPARRELVTKLHAVRQEVRGVQQDLLRGGVGAGAEVSMSAGATGTSVSIHVDDHGLPIQVVEVHETPMVAPPPERPLAIAPGPFADLRNAMDGESFDEGKLDLLREACGYHMFNADQALQLVSLLTFGDGRVDAAVMLHPRLLDPQNFFRVYGAFDFDSDKDEVRRRLGL